MKTLLNNIVKYKNKEDTPNCIKINSKKKTVK